MSREKQIEEIAWLIDEAYDNAEMTGSELHGYEVATHIYNAGFRKQEWIGVEERLPEYDNGDELIVCTEDGRVGAARFTAVNEEGFCWMENEGSDFYDGDLIEGVTHWMPLPEAPKMKGGADDARKRRKAVCSARLHLRKRRVGTNYNPEKSNERRFVCFERNI